MNRYFIILLGMILANHAKSQAVEILFSIPDSCVNTEEKLNQINIKIENHCSEDFWIDLEAIRFSIYQGDELILPMQDLRIGMFSPEDKVSNDGFVLVREGESENLKIYSSIFKNYIFEKNRSYLLKASYQKARDKLFKKVFNKDRSIGEIDLRICL